MARAPAWREKHLKLLLDAYLQVNFALFNSNWLKTYKLTNLQIGCLSVYNVFEPKKTYAN